MEMMFVGRHEYREEEKEEEGGKNDYEKGKIEIIKKRKEGRREKEGRKRGWRDGFRERERERKNGEK